MDLNCFTLVGDSITIFSEKKFSEIALKSYIRN